MNYVLVRTIGARYLGLVSRLILTIVSVKMEFSVQNNLGLTYSFMKLFNKIEQGGTRDSHFILHL